MAIKDLSVSLYGVIDMSRMLFTTLLGMMILGENLTFGKVIGIVLVITGLYLANKSPDENNGKAKITAILAALINCLLISVSSTMDSHWRIIRTRLKISIFGIFRLVVLERRQPSFVLRT